ncbi:vanadium-dependent haloperoxidase [Flavisolibacter sp. BT320]|nr:vanadium-dependent haloperoxidase [Flavisolibacter longurius]
MRKITLPGYYVAAMVSLLLFWGCSKEDLNPNPATPDVSKASVQRSTNGSSADAFDAAFVRSFYDLTCKIVKNTAGFFPPQASRAYGYISLALYEATAPGIKKGYTLAGQLNGLSSGSLPTADKNLKYSWGISANAALARMMQYMFEGNISDQNFQEIRKLEESNKSFLSKQVSTDIVARSESFGKAIADALYEFSKTDGGHHSYFDPFQKPYVLPQGPDKWVPTGPALSPVSPLWGNNRPMLSLNITGTKPPPCYPFSSDPSSKLYQDAYKVYQQVKNNTQEQVLIAKFWADDPFNTCTPTGHTFNILTQLLEETNASLAKTAVAYCKMGIAELDAFIACWKCKYDFNLLRPVTYIRRYIDPNFSTVIGTPAFPAYISGHSAEIGAASIIFTDMFAKGTGKYRFTDRTQIQYGFSPRTYNNFEEMAQECANSRFYAGIHYIQDNEHGLTQGKAIGHNVNKLLEWPPTE